MFDLEDISDAIAARYLPGTIGTPTGAMAMRASYGQMPNSIPITPAVVVVPQRGEVVYGTQTWDVTHEIDVLFFYSRKQADVPRSETERQRWLPYLLNALNGQMQLGLSGSVKSAMPTSYEFTELPYGGEQYDGIRISLDVIVREPVTMTP